jgi:hypothetical protein
MMMCGGASQVKEIEEELMEMYMQLKSDIFAKAGQEFPEFEPIHHTS